MTQRQFSEPRSAYFHVPFCAHRCGYCDFTLVAGRDELIEPYLQALAIELREIEEPVELDTAFVGGGTPTHLSPDQLSRLMELIHSHFRLSDGYEFSVEANPCGLTAEKIKVLADAGVNRFSLGGQSFDADMLKVLERDHSPDDILRVVEQLREKVSNVSLDLIFAVPGQTLASWRQTLGLAVGLDIQHISTYGLTFEKGTTFWGRRARGKLLQASDCLERAMYSEAIDRLAAAGFEQYEISNFARPGFSCRHNEVYWKGLPYLGFGPGAARYMAGRRQMNHRSVTTWLKRVSSGHSSVAETEVLSDEDRAREAIVIGLRRREGIAKREFRLLTGFDLDQLAGETMARECAAGLLENTATHVRLTREGLFFADTVFVDFL